MADVERKRVTLHPVKEDGTIDLSISLYPKTFVDGIVDRDGNEVDIALQNELDTKVADLNNKINLTNEAIGIFGTKIDELVEKEATFEERVGTQVENLDEEVSGEIARATEKEAQIEEEIEETTSELRAEISATATTLNQKITEEANTRKTLDIAINTRISNEETRAIEAESSLNTKIDTNTDQLNNTISELDSDVHMAIGNETTERQSADKALQQSIWDEGTRAALAENNIRATLSETDTRLSTAISDETTRAESTETALDEKINTEISDRETAIGGIATDLATETARAVEAEGALSEQLNDLSANLNTETENREAGDTANATAITNEAARASGAENALGARITNEVAGEASARESAIGNLQQALENAVTELSGTTDDLEAALEETNSALTTESTLREATDASLQSQIDTIVSKSDVVDVVGTKADLDNYDTSTLSNNDIIKVLCDEEESNQTTYYKFHTETGSFTLIGGVGPYSTATNVINGNDGSAEVSYVSENTNSITNRGYVDTAITEAEERTQQWEQELEDMLNLRLGNIDENLTKAYYCNVFLKEVEVVSCRGIKYNSAETFDIESNKVAKGNTITSITFSLKYNKLPRGCKLYFKDLTNNIEYPAIDAVDGDVEVSLYAINGLSLTKTSMWQITLLSAYDGSISTKVVPAYICNKVYWGTAMLAAGAISLPEWESELSPIFSTNKPVISGDSRYIIYAFPIADPTALDYGIPMFTLSPSQFVGGVSQYILNDTISTFNFTNEDNGFEELYYIYISDNASLGNITIKVERQ